MSNLLKYIKQEYSALSPTRRILNYIIVPVYLLYIVVFVALSLILMNIDENKFLIAFLILAGIFLALTTAILLSLKFVRKKELADEMARYDFDVAGAEVKEQYVYNKDEPIATFTVERSPFEEMSIHSTKYSGTAGLNKISERYGLDRTNAQSTKNYYDNTVKCSINDYSEHAEFTDFYVALCGEDKLQIFSSYCVKIDECGIEVNGHHLGYEKAHATINVYNMLFHVEIYLLIMFEDCELGIALKLDKDVVAMIKRFSIRVENREMLDFILDNKKEAFAAILKRGKITDRTLEKFNK